MNKNVIYVGLDVDDTQYHGAAFDQRTGETINFKCRPTLKGLVRQLEKLEASFNDCHLIVCYEASYIGFCLQRDLTEAGYRCDVIAPGSIPRKGGSKSVKTDRIDALDLAQFHAKALLTTVEPPDPMIEQDRDLLRSRQHTMQRLGDVRRHLQSLLRRHGLYYRSENKTRTHWTKHHYCWLERTIEDCEGSLKVNLQLLLKQIKALDEVLATYTQEIDAMAARPEYRVPVSALTCYKGIKNLIALTIITEIGDIKRFPHPRQLTAWVGMDIREYSSGGKQHRFGITREGNRYLRTAFIEANQRAYRSPIVSKDIKARRKGTDMQYIVIANRCLKRINKKGNRLLDARKHPNKVKVACAREMIGFVWESLNQAAA